MARFLRSQPSKPLTQAFTVPAAPPPSNGTPILTSGILVSRIISASLTQGQQVPSVGGIIK